MARAAAPANAVHHKLRLRLLNDSATVDISIPLGKERNIKTALHGIYAAKPLFGWPAAPQRRIDEHP